MVCWVYSPRFTSAGSRDAASRASRHFGAGEAARDTRRPYTRGEAGWRSGPRTAPPRAATGAGATGLEPATSGVTGRADRNDGGRRSTRIACKCGTSEPIWDVEARYVLTAPRRRLGHNRATAQQLGVAFLDAPSRWQVGEVNQLAGELKTRRRQHVFDAPLLRDRFGTEVVGACGPVALEVALAGGEVRSKSARTSRSAVSGSSAKCSVRKRRRMSSKRWLYS